MVDVEVLVADEAKISDFFLKETVFFCLNNEEMGFVR
jgi:hypothetical protein